MASLINVPVTKGKGTVEIDTEKLPDAVYREVMLQGLKVLLNRGMSKITKETYTDPEELKVAAMEAATKNVEAVMEGKIRFTGGAKSNKASGAVMTEARRLARNLVKDAMKRQGIKISHVEASEITKAANALLADDPTLIEQAKAALEERSKVDVKIDVGSIPISAKKKAAADAKKAKDKEGLSAKQAGKVKTRNKGEARVQ